MKTKIIIWTLLISISLNAQLVSSNILQRVFLVKYNNSVGTLFTIEVENRQYLISAKHVFPQISANDTIEVFQEKDWRKIKVTVVGETQKDVDIIVFATDLQISPTHELVVTNHNLYLSQEVFFLGFPFTISTDADQVNNYFPIPFVKKGIISAFIDYKDGGRKILLIDGINNSGFSGGPIVTYDLKTKKMKAVAVISGFRTQEDPVKLGKDATALQAITNSGILIGYSIQHAINVINSNRIGVKIK